MRDEHIIDLLDRVSIPTLSDDERARVEAHASGCPACRRAYEAARLSADLLAARAGAEIEPSPFFHTRVMAALRERQATTEGNALTRMWRAAGALVSAMAVVVALLAGATFVTYSPATPQPRPEIATGQTPYSEEWDLYEAAGSGEADLSYDQMVVMMYDSEDIDEQ